MGWVLFWVMLIAILRDRIKSKRLQAKKVLLEKIVIGISILVILTKGVVFFVFPQTEPDDEDV